jgi:glycosyltransferase involved in cell wall biosynthesis
MGELTPDVVAPALILAVDLPIPPASKSGWPWAPHRRGSRPLASDNWPRITIVTPSFNQAEFLEETIRSVLLQDYPKLEYIVIDGGSTDGSVEIIRKYEPWLSYWVSEPDRGQSHAINKGFSRATGEVIGSLNSAARLLPGALVVIAQAVLDHPEAVLVYGEADLVRRDGSFMNKNVSRAYDRRWLLEQGDPIPQPSAFFRRRVFHEVGGLDENLHFTMDYDLWFRLGDYGQVVYLEKPLSSQRVHPEAKTSSGDHRFFLELQQVVERYGGHEIPRLHQEWLIPIHWRKAMAAYCGRDWAAGRRELGHIVRNVPAWQASDGLAQRLVDQLWTLVL